VGEEREGKERRGEVRKWMDVPLQFPSHLKSKKTMIAYSQYLHI
jgi:hypothetical protein